MKHELIFTPEARTALNGLQEMRDTLVHSGTLPEDKSFDIIQKQMTRIYQTASMRIEIPADDILPEWIAKQVIYST